MQFAIWNTKYGCSTLGKLVCSKRMGCEVLNIFMWFVTPCSDLCSSQFFNVFQCVVLC